MVASKKYIAFGMKKFPMLTLPINPDFKFSIRILIR